MKKKLLLIFGWPMVIMGIALLAVSYFTGLSHYNAVLYAGWTLVTIGCVCRVAGLRRAG